MQERKEKGLCWFCDEKYHPGHKRTKPKIYLLKGMEGEEEKNEELGNKESALTLIETNEGEVRKLLGITLHAIAGSLALKTIRMFAEINHQKILVLIDTGSTRSFIDPNVARKMNISKEESCLTV